jgi:hypothetical protein
MSSNKKVRVLAIDPGTRAIPKTLYSVAADRKA